MKTIAYENKAVNTLLESIITVADAKVSGANYDSTRDGVVTSVPSDTSTGFYSVKSKGMVYSAYTMCADTFAVGDNVLLLFPQNTNTKVYISGRTNSNVISGGSSTTTTLKTGVSNLTTTAKSGDIIVGTAATKDFGAADNELPTNATINSALAEKASLSHTHSTGDISSLTEFIRDLCYPVGSLWISSNSVSPATIIGGTWTQIKDTFILACGDTYSINATGGEAIHTLTSDEIPAHSHSVAPMVTSTTGGTGSFNYYRNGGDDSSTDTTNAKTSDTGGGQPHNNMPPYIAKYIWERTA